MFFTKRTKTPKFRAGDILRVKSRDSIFGSIYPTNKLDGCLFVEQMWDYCDNYYKVLRVVDTFFDEQKKRTFKSRLPLYILENLICEGREDSFQIKCDHGCFLLWHEDWLEKSPISR